MASTRERPWGRVAQQITIAAAIGIGLAVAMAAGGCSGDDDGEGPLGGDPPQEAPDASMLPDDDDDPPGGLSVQCNALCSRTPTASMLEGQCIALTLEDIGGYNFGLFSSCRELDDAFRAGIATAEQCVACYLDANVAGTDCAQADATCSL